MNKRKFNIIYILVWFLSCTYTSVSSQTVKAEVDKESIFIGEQVKLKLSVERGKFGINWFKFPDSVNHLEVVNRSKIDTVVKGAFTNYYQTISITSFDSGRWEFPSLSVAGIAETTSPITINVSPVDVSQMQDYNDIKEIEEVEAGNNWLIIGIIAAVTLISIGLVYWFLVKKKKAVVPANVTNGNHSPLEWAMNELKKLHLQNNASPAEVKKYYSDLVSISRTFFSLQLQQQSLQKTSDEWILGLQALSVEQETKISFFQFIRLADTVKFAKYLPPVSESEVSVTAIKNMFQKVALLHSNLYSKYQPK